ncbi:MAG: HNH endonuclease [Dehalococcoidia bacterium]
MRFFTHYWQNDTWAAHGEGQLNATASNQFRRSGVAPGDAVYVVTVIEGILYVGCRLVVDEVVSRREAARRLGTSDLWNASDFVLAKRAERFLPDRAVPRSVVERLRFVPDRKPKFKKAGVLDQQTLRGIRELTPASARLLDEVLDASQRSTGEFRKPFTKRRLREVLQQAWREASETERNFLAAHYGLPGHAGSATDIARAAGFRDYHASNAHYGAFAERVARLLGVEPDEWLSVLVTVTGKNPKGHSILELDEGVVQAIDALGIIDKQATESRIGIPDGITHGDLLEAMARLDAGESHGFGESRKFDVLYRGRRYPPKAVVGLAARRLAGRDLGPSDFSGGLESKCLRILDGAGFDVVDKDGQPVAESDEERAEATVWQRTDIGPTQKETLVLARRGQGVYRKNLEQIETACRLTGCRDPRHLRASHIKPWKDSSDAEKLDGNNGLLLAPHVDHLFDGGWITFEDDGTMKVSRSLGPALLRQWGLPESAKAGGFNEEQKRYLKYHREQVFGKRGPGETHRDRE